MSWPILSYSSQNLRTDKFEGTVEAVRRRCSGDFPYHMMKDGASRLDGEDDDYYMIGDALTVFDVTEGTHTITFEYTPEGLWKGTWIS